MGSAQGKRSAGMAGRAVWAAVAVLAAASAAMLWARQERGQGATAGLWIDGAEAATFSLAPGREEKADLHEAYGLPMHIEIKDGAIRFYDVACPDQICVATGFISRDGEVAVCMPNRAALTVVDEAG